MHTPFEKHAYRELLIWQAEVQKKPSFTNRAAVFVQKHWNRIIPEKVHGAITVVIEKMVKGVLFGAPATARNVIRRSQSFHMVMTDLL